MRLTSRAILGFSFLFIIFLAIFGGAASMPTKQRQEVGDILEYKISNPLYPELKGIRIEVTNITVDRANITLYEKFIIREVYFNLTVKDNYGETTYKAYQDLRRGLLYIWQKYQVYEPESYRLNRGNTDGNYTETWGWQVSTLSTIPRYLMITPLLFVGNEISPEGPVSLPIISIGYEIYANNLHGISRSRYLTSYSETYWTWDRDSGYLLQYKVIYAVPGAYVLGQILYELSWANFWPFSAFWFVTFWGIWLIFQPLLWGSVAGYLFSYSIISIYDRRKRKVPVISENAKMWVYMFIVLAAALGFIVALQVWILPMLR